VLATGLGTRSIVTAPTHTAPRLPAWSALPPADEDPGLPVLEQVAPAVADAAASAECGDLAECVVGLSDEESRALADALREKIGPGSTM
jgi:hypothetical protein